MKSVFAALSIVFVIPLMSYSQQDSGKQVIGKTYTTTVRGDYNVSVIFHRNKQAIVVIVTSCDSLPRISDFSEDAKKYGNDVVATFHRITYRKPGTNKEIEIDVSPYNLEDTEPKSNARHEIDKLKNLNFISGTIYFSGPGFTNVTSAKAGEKSKLETYYNRSMPGTTITLENCIYKNAAGSLSQPLNKSIKLN